MAGELTITQVNSGNIYDVVNFYFSFGSDVYNYASNADENDYSEGDEIYALRGNAVSIYIDNELINTYSSSYYEDKTISYYHEIDKFDDSEHTIKATVVCRICELEEQREVETDRKPSSGWWDEPDDDYTRRGYKENRVTLTDDAGNFIGYGYYYTKTTYSYYYEWADTYDDITFTASFNFPVNIYHYQNFKFKNKDNENLNSGDIYYFDEFIKNGISNLRAFQGAAKKRANKNYDCPSWGADGTHLTAAAVNAIYEYCGRNERFNSGDKITFKLFKDLQDWVRGE